MKLKKSSLGSRPSWFKALVILIGFSVLVGCAELRKYTYPPDFKYLERFEVRSTMAEFGKRIWEMDTILASSDRALTERDRVVEILDELSAYAASLDPDGRPSNHPVIADNIQPFIEAVRVAKRHAADNPPNFYQAGQLAGNCMACHVNR